MRVFSYYCEDNEGNIYAYDSVTASVLKVIDDNYVIEGFLPILAQGIKILNVFIYNDYFVMMGMERYSFIFNLKNKHSKILDLGDFKEDKNGWRVSNIIKCEDGLIFVPRVLTCLKKYQIDEFESEKSILEANNIVDSQLFAPVMIANNDSFVRSWGAFEEKNKLYMIVSEKSKDSLLIIDIDNKNIKRVELGLFKKLFHLERNKDGFFVQGIKGNEFYLIKIDFYGIVLFEKQAYVKSIDFHMQWFSDNQIVMPEYEWLHIFDEELNFDERIRHDKYFICDKFFYDNSKVFVYDNRLRQFNTVTNRYCMERNLNNEEYLLRIKRFYSKIKKQIIMEDFFNYDLSDYLHMI